MTGAARAVRAGLRLGLAHHPLCTEFRRDVVRLGRLPVCSGCLATWPAFAAAFPAALATRLHGAPALALLAAGLVLGGPHLASYLRRRSRAERAAAKLLGGVGLGLAAAGALSAGWPAALLAGASLAGALASAALQAVRLRRILATCDACPFRRDWPSCPGFQGAGDGGGSAAPAGPGWPGPLAAGHPRRLP